MAPPTLTASYNAPATSAPFTLSESTPALPERSTAAAPLTTAQRTAHLAHLRAATGAMQARINAELTARMDADVAREGRKDGRSAEDDAREEQNYGEEGVDAEGE
jgi:hypothetical protein